MSSLSKRRAGATSKVRKTDFDKTGGACHFCGKLLVPDGPWDVDHVVPVLRGGTSELSNLLPICCECNRLRSAQRPPKIRATMLIGIYARRAIKNEKPVGKKLERYLLKSVAKRWGISANNKVDAGIRAQLVDGTKAP